VCKLSALYSSSSMRKGLTITAIVYSGTKAKKLHVTLFATQGDHSLPLAAEMTI
jgi:hypothetical protein